MSEAKSNSALLELFELFPLRYTICFFFFLTGVGLTAVEMMAALNFSSEFRSALIAYSISFLGTLGHILRMKSFHKAG